jgi:carbon monoxide dehydrogenase subunit G
MPRVERSIYTTQPVQVVWRFLQDYTTTERWDVATSTTDLVEGDGAVGTVYRKISKMFGREQKIVYTVSDRVPPYRLALVGQAGRVRFIDTFEIQSLGSEVRVRYTITFAVFGPARIMSMMLARRLRQQTDESIDRLEQVLAQL